MSKYKVGDTVWLVGEITSKSESDSLIDFVNGKRIWFQDYCLMDADKTYSEGLADAWELARKVSHMCLNDMNKCFGLEELDKFGGDKALYEHFTPQEALAKIEAYEESKAIKVGDVVTCFNDYKGVVLDCDDELGTLDVFSENGCVEGLAFSDVKKTGKHLDIEHLLEQIRGKE